MMTAIWLVLAAVLIIIEIITLGLTTIWFAGGAIIAAFTALFGGNLIIQAALFMLVSIVLFVFTRPVAQKHLFKNNEKTNVESLVGEIGIVTKEINNAISQGTVKLNGMDWTARAADETVIPEGKEVIVELISGVKLIVKAKN